MFCASCLVTSSPEFEDPEQTPPELIAATATPDIRNILEVDESTGRVLLNALVRSEEDAGETIKFRLLLDYGIPNNDQPPKPYQLIVDRGEVALPSAPGEEQAVSAACGRSSRTRSAGSSRRAARDSRWPRRTRATP